MAQNITLLGASYTAVPAVTLPKTGGGTARFDDASITTATASDVASGKVFLASDGTITTGTSSGGGGSSSWTKVAETSYQVSTTNTTATVFATWATGHSEIWTSDKWVYVRIRDTAGKRTRHLYGSDTFFTNVYKLNGTNATKATLGFVYGTLRVESTGLYAYRYGYHSSGYGIFPSGFYPNGDIELSTRYNSSYTQTIDSTYSVEVYLLDPPTGAPIFT